MHACQHCRMLSSLEEEALKKESCTHMWKHQRETHEMEWSHFTVPPEFA